MENITLNNVSEGPKYDDITMNVSPIVSKNGIKKAFVLFTLNEKMAEFELPSEKMISNTGFDEKTIAALMEYVVSQKDSILSIAQNTSPLKAFMGLKQGESIKDDKC